MNDFDPNEFDRELSKNVFQFLHAASIKDKGKSIIEAGCHHMGIFMGIAAYLNFHCNRFSKPIEETPAVLYRLQELIQEDMIERQCKDCAHETTCPAKHSTLNKTSCQNKEPI